MKPQTVLVDRIVTRLKNNPLGGTLIAIGTVVIALSTFTNATKNLFGLLKGQSPDSARAELSRLSVEFTPQAFVESVRRGDIRAVTLFVTAGMNPNAKDDDGNTAVMNAIAAGRMEIVNALIAAKPGVNEKNVGGATALDWAAARGQLDTVRLLVDKGASQETIDEGVVAAAEKGQSKIIQTLLDDGARLSKVGSRALLAAAGSNAVGATDEQLAATAKLLLTLGVDVNAKDNDGWTPLLLASDKDRTSVVQALLDGGADTNARCDCLGYLSGGWTALMIASREGREDLVKMLIAKRAAVDLRNNAGKTALTVAAAKGNAEIVRMLLDDGSDVNAKDVERRTPLMHAASEGNREVVRLLLQRGAHVDN